MFITSQEMDIPTQSTAQEAESRPQPTKQDTDNAQPPQTGRSVHTV